VRCVQSVGEEDVRCVQSVGVEDVRCVQWVGEGEVRSVQRGGEEEEKRQHLYDLAVNGKIILRWVFKEFYLMVWADMVKIRTGTNEVLFLRSNKTLTIIKCGEFFK
jgi:hypothetical protein